MDHIHNETVLAFLKLHREHPNIQKLLAEEDAEVAEMNEALGTGYKDFLDYLERNSGDDAACTMEKLEALVTRKRRRDSGRPWCRQAGLTRPGLRAGQAGCRGWMYREPWGCEYARWGTV